MKILTGASWEDYESYVEGLRHSLSEQDVILGADRLGYHLTCMIADQVSGDAVCAVVEDMLGFLPAADGPLIPTTVTSKMIMALHEALRGYPQDRFYDDLSHVPERLMEIIELPVDRGVKSIAAGVFTALFAHVHVVPNPGKIARRFVDLAIENPSAACSANDFRIQAQIFLDIAIEQGSLAREDAIMIAEHAAGIIGRTVHALHNVAGREAEALLDKVNQGYPVLSGYLTALGRAGNAPKAFNCTT